MQTLKRLGVWINGLPLLAKIMANTLTKIVHIYVRHVIATILVNVIYWKMEGKLYVINGPVIVQTECRYYLRDSTVSAPIISTLQLLSIYLETD